MLWSAEIRLFRALENASRSALPLSRALLTFVERSGDAALRESAEELDQGVSLSDAMRRRRKRFPLWQTEIVAAGEASGRTDTGFRLIWECLEERRGFWLSLIPKLAYPVVLVHFAPCAFHVGLLMNKGPVSFLAAVFWTLLPIYAGIWVLWQAVSILREHPSLWSRVPFTGGFLREKVAYYLSLLVRAGIPVSSAVPLAAHAGGLPQGHAGIKASQERLMSGGSFVETLGALGLFKREELDQLHAGEAAGTIDAELGHLAGSLKERNRSVVSTVLYVLPSLVLILIGILLAKKIVSFYTGRFGQLEELGLL